jgi:hypothetical protein
LTPERIAAHEQRLAERRAQDELERLTYQWEAEERQREQDEAESARSRWAAVQRQREEAERQRDAADRRNAALAASDAATAARETRRRLAQLEAAELRARHQAAHWAQWQAVADGIGKLAALHGPQPAPLADRLAAMEEQVEPEPEPSAWTRFNWRS